jgi:hypothetical protein
MSDLQIIETTLGRAARRRRWERAFRGLWQGLLIGAIIAFAAVGAYKLLPIPVTVVYGASAAAVLAALMGFIIGGWRRMPLTEVARWVDGKQHLQERLSTALEVARSSEANGTSAPPGNWRELIVADAMTHVKDLDPRRLVQFKLPKVSRWALLLLALCVGLGFVPEYRSKAYVQKQNEARVIKEAGQQLADLTKRQLQQHKPAIETQKAMDAVNELGDQLAKQPMTRGEALKDIANVTDKLKDQLSDIGKDPSLKRLEQAARSSSSMTSPEVARLQKQIEETQKQLGSPTGTPEDMEKMKAALDKIQEAAKAAAAKNGGISPTDKEKLSQSLSALSKQAQEMGLQMPNIDQAMQALQAAQADMFLKDLEQASNDLEKTKEMAKSLQQMQQQMDKMGKDLAEQLKYGQAETAQATLQKMSQDLQSGKLTEQQLQKLADEVGKAIDPAGQYGKVADHLKQASKQLGQGQKPGAAESLNKAADELAKMMQQMGDAQALASELDALKKASMCVGTCQGWGQGQSLYPGTGQGGKPGKGVGTWADDNSGWGYVPPQSDRWDNSGVIRPDTTPKGQSDRGDGDLNDALKPTKVKGQFSPGGQMPSITLKGVSIKGQSKVAFDQSAAAAAQADAQSALSQEKVPRAYQGAVRDYFDDLKK